MLNCAQERGFTSNRAQPTSAHPAYPTMRAGPLHHAFVRVRLLSIYALSSVHGVAISPLQQDAIEGLNDLGDFPLGSIVILRQLFDAAPGCGGIRFAFEAVIEEFAVLLAGVLFILSAVYDFHLSLPSAA